VPHRFLNIEKKGFFKRMFKGSATAWVF
jgi:hypothetical protein